MQLPTKSITSEQQTILQSRFIGFFYKAHTIEEHQNALIKLKANYPDARHICYAFRVLNPQTHQIVEGSSDDGEPRGSAGKPMLAPLRGANLICCSAFVVRYFGGTKLGIGGLVRAYGGLVSEMVKACEPEAFKLTSEVRLNIPYNQFESFKHSLTQIGVDVNAMISTFTDQVDVCVQLNEEQERSCLEQWGRFKST